MKDSQLKWASCCSRVLECRNCERDDECRKWFRYVENHGNVKSYAHFDKRTSLRNNLTRRNVLNPRWVSRYAFWPLIQFEKSKDKFVGEKGGIPAHLERKSPRIIRYCSHLDRCVFQRYSFLLDQRYNRAVAERGIDDSAVAYRTNKSLNNLHHARRAIDFIERTNRCLIFITDFDSYFDRINHEALKQSVCNLLDVDVLPADYYAVLKNITAFSSWSWNSIMSYWRKRDPSISRKGINSKELVLPREVFRELSKSQISHNLSGKGIPQGSPLSAILSNVYLMDFDGKLRGALAQEDGLYMRYCDDLLVVVPIECLASGLKLIENLQNMMKAYPGVVIKEEKTAILEYAKTGDEGATLSYVVGAAKTEPNAVLDYLGITFDGSVRKMRPKAISKYHYRMHRKARSIARQQKGRTNIYGIYSERSRQIAGKRSFVDYAKSAKKIVDLNDSQVDSVINHNMEKIAKAINKASLDP